MPDPDFILPNNWYELSREQRARLTAFHFLESVGARLYEADYADWRKLMKLD